MRTHQEDSILEQGKQASLTVSSQLAEELAAFVAPLFSWLRCCWSWTL